MSVEREKSLVMKRNISHISQKVTHPRWVTFLLIKRSDPPLKGLGHLRRGSLQGGSLVGHLSASMKWVTLLGKLLFIFKFSFLNLHHLCQVLGGGQSPPA